MVMAYLTGTGRGGSAGPLFTSVTHAVPILGCLLVIAVKKAGEYPLSFISFVSTLTEAFTEASPLNKPLISVLDICGCRESACKKA